MRKVSLLTRPPMKPAKDTMVRFCSVNAAQQSFSRERGKGSAAKKRSRRGAERGSVDFNFKFQ